eukprot:sb/3470085/
MVGTNQNSLFRLRDWLSANEGPVFSDLVNDNNPSLVKKGGAWRGIKNFKAGLMIAVIIGVYLIFVLPVSIMALIQMIFNLQSVPKEAALVVTYLLLCNSFCNPIIYGIMNKEFRQEFKNIIRCTSNRSYRQQNMRRESLAFSSSCNVSVLVKKPSINGITQLGTSTGCTCPTCIRSKSPLTRLKYYFSCCIHNRVHATTTTSWKTETQETSSC